MPFNKGNQPHERIILMGGPGSGKTTAWLNIAELHRKTKSDAKFYVLDTDFAVERNLMGFPKLAESGMLHIETALDYEDMRKASEILRKKVKPGDWLITDIFSSLWELSQEYFTGQVMGESKADYFLSKRIEAAKKNKTPDANPYEGWYDWPVIKFLHNKVAENLTYTRGHVLLTTGPKQLNRTTDDKAIVADFGHLGYRPEGEKRFAHNVHTVLMLEQKKQDQWLMTTGKDREREKLQKDEVGNFAMTYLVKIAGWSLT